MNREIVFIRDGEMTSGWDKISRWIKTAKNGSYVWTLKSEKSKASSRMFGYLFGYLYPAILSEMGQEPSVEALNELDREFKLRFGAAEVATTFELRRKLESTGDGKPFVKIKDTMKPKSKADYTVDEMKNYFMAIQRIASEMWDVVLKDPDPNWKDGWVEKVCPVGDGQGRAKEFKNAK